MYISTAVKTGNFFSIFNDEKAIQLLKSIVNSDFKWQFQDDGSSNIAALQGAHSKGDLVLVLGAGASVDYGLPSWNTLLYTLMSKSLMVDAIKTSNGEAARGVKEKDQKAMLFAEVFNDLFCPSPLIAGRYLSNAFGNSGEAFEREIQKILYNNIEKAFVSPLVKELVQLCAAPGRSPSLDSIISYNFDDILEEAVWKASITIPIKPIFALGQHPSSHELPIYHVHGYIPRTGPIGGDNKITLGEDVYHQQYLDIYNWQNLVQLNKFKEKTCLFIGSSLTDPNQRRLLDIAVKQRAGLTCSHYIIKKKISADALSEKLKAYLEINPNTLNKKMLATISFDELAKTLALAYQQFEYSDASSLGIEIVWVNEFEEIPAVIRKIRGHR